MSSRLRSPSDCPACDGEGDSCAVCRPETVTTIPTAEYERMRAIYDQYAFGEQELRYLRFYRSLNAAARVELDNYLVFLKAKYEALHSPDHGTQT